MILSDNRTKKKKIVCLWVVTEWQMIIKLIAESEREWMRKNKKEKKKQNQSYCYLSHFIASEQTASNPICIHIQIVQFPFLIKFLFLFVFFFIFFYFFILTLTCIYRHTHLYGYNAIAFMWNIVCRQNSIIFRLPDFRQ